jgi:hypothetical protein
MSVRCLETSGSGIVGKLPSIISSHHNYVDTILTVYSIQRTVIPTLRNCYLVSDFVAKRLRLRIAISKTNVEAIFIDRHESTKEPTSASTKYLSIV